METKAPLIEAGLSVHVTSLELSPELKGNLRTVCISVTLELDENLEQMFSPFNDTRPRIGGLNCMLTEDRNIPLALRYSGATDIVAMTGNWQGAKCTVEYVLLAKGNAAEVFNQCQQKKSVLEGSIQRLVIGEIISFMRSSHLGESFEPKKAAESIIKKAWESVKTDPMIELHRQLGKQLQESLMKHSIEQQLALMPEREHATNTALAIEEELGIKLG